MKNKRDDPGATSSRDSIASANAPELARNDSSSGQSPSDLQLLNKEAQDLQKRVNLGSLGKNPELRNEAMQLVFRIEDATSQDLRTGHRLGSGLDSD